MRRERGFGVNPWTHAQPLPRLAQPAVDPAYADPMRAWLADLQPGSLLILDEAHHAAPVERRALRDRDEVHACGARPRRPLRAPAVLSATPHNGHSNSFSTLLELLDPYRFTRGVKVKGKAELEA